MDIFHNVASAVADFDLDQENIAGIFTNLTLLTMVLRSITKDKPFPETKPAAGPVYDYIIVGAGPAGSVMANRLSENTCRKVLLLEAGRYTPLLTEVPAFARPYFNSRIDWAYKTEPQKYAALGHDNNRVIWNSGKGLGGGSILNAMVYTRGNKKDYDQWEEDGATGWSYESVKKYFLKLEDNKNIDELDQEYHQEGGPQTIERINYTPEIKEPIMEALAELGYRVVDVNGRQQTGIYNMQALFRNQQRCSAAKAYLVPAENRPNLDIVKGAFVTKIIIEDGKAVGVEYDQGIIKGRTARANEEVIVSCGTVRTAQLLMLSGIGPSEELRKHNIRVIADLPVGKNLQDHCASSIFYQVNDTIQTVYQKFTNPLNVADYILNRHGPLTAPNALTLVAFTNGLNATLDSRDSPEQEIYFGEYTVTDAQSNSNLKKGIYEKYYADYIFKPLYICFVHNLRPKSRGKITLRSTNPHDVPSIDPNYFQDEDDLRVIAEGLEVCSKIAESQPMRRVQARPPPIAFPGCEEEFETNKTEYYYCHARHLTTAAWHPVGTARMGLPDDPRSVVDPELRVIGVKGLRVVNAAVMPNVPSGNTDVPTLMVAEKAYDMMEKDAKCPDTKITVGPVTVEPVTAGPGVVGL